jgi:hypothetical protein
LDTLRIARDGPFLRDMNLKAPSIGAKGV